VPTLMWDRQDFLVRVENAGQTNPHYHPCSSRSIITTLNLSFLLFKNLRVTTYRTL